MSKSIEPYRKAAIVEEDYKTICVKCERHRFVIIDTTSSNGSFAHQCKSNPTKRINYITGRVKYVSPISKWETCRAKNKTGSCKDFIPRKRIIQLRIC